MATKHKIKKSDHISKLAKAHGYHNWQTLWNANGKLKKARSNPNILYKSDRSNNKKTEQLEVPKPGEKKIGKTAEAHHPFVVPNNKVFLRLRLLKDDFTAIKDAEYTLKVDGTGPLAGVEKKGKTNAQGQFEEEIPRDAQNGELTVRIAAEDSETEPAEGANAEDSTLRGDVPITWKLQIGALNPIQENAPDQWCVSGVQQRLNNLAFNTGPVDGIRGTNTNAAIRAFKDLFQVGSEADKPGAQTQSKLYDVHDKPDSIVGPPPSST